MYAYNLGRTGAPDVANYTRRRQIQRVLQSTSSAKADICRGPGSEGVDHSLRGASTKRSEPHAGQRKGQSKSSDQPTWADKLKTPNGTRPPATNTPPAPDPRDQELRALRVEAFGRFRRNQVCCWTTVAKDSVVLCYRPFQLFDACFTT
ncbi:hypothetical protein MRX96_012700 [Rhipicephalus microplus]